MEWTDSFLVGDSEYCVESFRYQALAVPSDEKKESKDISVGRRLEVGIW